MNIKLIAASAALSFAVNALPALADDTKLTREQVGHISGGVGAVVGAGIFAGGTAAYLNSQEYKASPAGMKDAAGRLNRHKNAEFNRKYLDRYGEEHAKKIDEAKKKQAIANRAKQKELKARAKQERKLAKKDSKAAEKLQKKHQKRDEFKAHQKHKRDMRKLERKIGAEKGAAQTHVNNVSDVNKAQADGKFGDHKAKKHGKKSPRKNVRKTGHAKSDGYKVKKARGTKGVRTGARATKKGAKAAEAGKNAAKLGKKTKKMRKIVAGGAVGLVAGAALGEQVPDVFDAAGYSIKMAKNPTQAPKMLFNTAKGGVAMAGRMANTVTDPGKMARNLGGAAQGVGRSIANTGAYKSMARTKTGRTIGKATSFASAKVSQGYKSFARSKTGKATGAVLRTADKYTFKQANKGVKVATKAVSRGSKVVGRSVKTQAKKAKKTVRKVGKSLKKAFHF